MRSFSRFMNASISLGSLTSSLPESVAVTGASGEQLLGSFTGWTAKLSFTRSHEYMSTSLLTPITVFSSSSKVVDCEWVKVTVESYKAADDVFQESFMQAVFLQGAGSNDASLLNCLGDAYGTKVILTEKASNQSITVKSSDTIPKGPYLAHISNSDITLGPVYRIYPDTLQAFMSGILPEGTSGKYQYATVNTVSDSTIGIPVPSRLYSLNATSARLPFNGLRITVKDIIDIEGVKTSMGSRAWFELYDTANKTAPAVKRAVEMGAVLVGKTKTAQFANADRVTADWVDYHDAFNPRGDGYQDTGVSSAGAGAATAGYDWVDVSICTDTGGSIRIPASKQGVFALRPSFGALSNDGVMLEGEYFDSVGFHTRSPHTLQSFGKAWLADSNLTTGYTRFPTKLIMPSNMWPVSSNASQAVYATWVQKLAVFLNATVETTSIDEYWNTTAWNTTAGTNGTEFFSYMQQVAFNLNWKNQIAKVIAPFQRAYAAKFGGRQPFINPFPAARFASAKNVTDDDVKESYKRFVYFREWFGREVVLPEEKSCSQSLFLIPMFPGTVSYRNTVYTPPDVSSWSSFLMYYYSVQSQGPEVVFPIGQVSYLSTISGIEEKLPVSIDILAHRGCDLMLLDLAKALADEGLLKEVKTGRVLF